MTDPAARIPIFLLTGFLGSGKTSLLNALLKDPDFRDTAVIVNEFGDIGLDHLLIASAKENTILLDAGCLCCAMVDSLKETLLDLLHRRARSDLPMFRRVVIETSGLADPGPILQQLTRDPLVTHSYRLRGVLCTIDAPFGEDQIARHPEAAAQAAVADWLIVTKTDLLGGGLPLSLNRLLRSLNPSADIRQGSQGISLLTGGNPEAVPWLNDIGRSHGEPGHGHRARDHAISSQSFWLNRPVTWAGLAAWTEWMRQAASADLLRSKGLMNVVGVTGPVVLHGVRDRFELTRSAAWPDQERRSRLVIIGRDLDKARQQTGLGWLYAEPGTPPTGQFDSPPPPLPPFAIGSPHAI